MGRLNKATLQMLQIVTPYVAWGYPNLKTVKSLVYKRGFAKINKQRIPITDNTLIEKHFANVADADVICVEDLIHEIYTVGPAFNRPTTSCGPSSCLPPTVASPRSACISTRAVTPDAARTRSTPWCRRCCKHVTLPDRLVRSVALCL